jgi:hypothetical protein
MPAHALRTSSRSTLDRTVRCRVFVPLLLLSALAGTGCSNAGEGAFSGAAIGALGGLTIGSLSGDAGEGAAIGAVSGAIVGGVIGDQNNRNSRADTRSRACPYGHSRRQSGCCD